MTSLYRLLRYGMPVFALMLAVLTASDCFGQKIALLLGEGRHDTEFDYAFKNLGWDAPDRFKCTKEDMKRFTDSAGKYDMVISVPLFNYGPEGKRTLVKGDTETAEIKKYISNGGVMIFTDGSYENVRGWLSEIDPAFGGLSTGKCTSSAWGVLGFVRNAEPVHPIRMFPNLITEGDSWPHFEKLPNGSKWQILAYCSEGKPVCLYQKYGKGFVVLTTLRQPNFKILENYYANCMLLKANLSVGSFTMSELKPGPGSLDIKLAAPPPAGSSLSFEIVDAKNKAWTFTTNITGRSCSLNYVVEARGNSSVSLYVNTPKERILIFNRRIAFPKIFEIFPNAYRGILSTKRRVENVSFLIKLAPATEDLTSAGITLDFYDSSSNLVHTAEISTPTNAVSEIWAPVPLPKTLGAGGYSVRATLLKPGRIRAMAETSFEILAPKMAQTIIDEDRTFLVNGVPFFPLGIYHVDNDYEKVSEAGFNSCQFWKWMLNFNRYGIPTGLYRATANNLKCLFESHHGGEAIIKECTDGYKDHPAILMWYVADEPAEGSETGMKMTNDAWHKYDKNHPTYLVSCRPDLFKMHHVFADVMAFNPAGDVPTVVKWIKDAQEATGGRKPLVLVPWSIPSNFDTVRRIAYTAIVHDIRGIFWYCWKQAGGGPLGIGLSQKPDYQPKFKKLFEEIGCIQPALLTADRRTFEEGDVHGIVCRGRSPNERAAVMINVSDKTLQAEFTIPEIQNAKKVFDAFTGKPTVMENGLFKRQLKPYEVVALKWE